MNTPSEAAQKWAEGVKSKGRNYMRDATPEDRIEDAKRLYVAGQTDHFSFEASISLALGLSPLRSVFAGRVV